MKRKADSESTVTVDLPVFEETYAHFHCLCGLFLVAFSISIYCVLSLHQVIFWNALSIAPSASADGK